MGAGGGINPEGAIPQELQGQLPPQMLELMQHGLDEDLVADMLQGLPPDQAAELQRQVQEGTLLLPKSPILLVLWSRNVQM